jgi:hypothetical protein
MKTEYRAWSRRHFLQGTVAAAACGLARRGTARQTVATSVIDTHVYLGRWPFRCLAGDEPSKLVANLRRHQVSRAWAGSFDALFHKDVHGANLRLVETCRHEGDGVLVPFGAVNPVLPDWEEDLRRCHEHFKMPGIRLHPNYHGYTLDDPRFARLLELAAARKLVVQLVTWMSDERHAFLNPHVPQVELAPLAAIVNPLRGLHLLVTNGCRTLKIRSLRALVPRLQVCFDFSRIASADKLRDLVELVSADRIVIGSASPLADFEATLLRMRQAKLSAAQTRAICHGTAQRMVE